MWDDDAEPFVDNTEMLAELLSTVAEDYGFDLDSALMRSTRATPRPSATRRGKPRSTASAARAGSSRRMTHRMPGSTAVALRMSHRGQGIRRTRRRPRRPRIEELPPRRKWGGEVARGVDNHSFTPPVAVGTCNGQPAHPFIELVDAVLRSLRGYRGVPRNRYRDVRRLLVLWKKSDAQSTRLSFLLAVCDRARPLVGNLPIPPGHKCQSTHCNDGRTNSQ